MNKYLLITLALILNLTVDAQDAEINGKVWQSTNLSTNKYSNGDIIKEAKDMEDWLIYAQKGIGCYIKHNNNYYYSYYAIYDNRGLAPAGYRIATEQDWLDISFFLKRYDYPDKGKILKSTNGWASYTRNVNGGVWKPKQIDGNGTNQLGFNAQPCGYYSNKGTFVADNGFKAYWACKKGRDDLYFVSLGSEPQEKEYYYRDLLGEPSNFMIDERVKEDGFCIRCVKNN